MATEQLNGAHRKEGKVRLSIKVSESLGKELIDAYQKELDKQEHPPFKEEFLGSYSEDCVSIAAGSVVDEADARQAAGISHSLAGEQDQSRQLRTMLYISMAMAVLLGLLAIRFYQRYKAYV